MKLWLKKLFRKTNKTLPLVHIYISKSVLINNLNSFRNQVPDRVVAPVLKSNAYGHGLAIIAQALKNEDVPFFIIDSYFEAHSLRNEGVKTPLLIIGYSSIENIIKNSLHDIRFTITSLDALTNLAKKIREKTKIHLKIDTGMNRQGISLDEIDASFDIIRKSENIVLEGACSHLADADNINDKTFTRKQILVWNMIVNKFRNQFPNLKYWHISNTVGHAYSLEAHANLTRLGIGLYLTPTPALTMETIISSVKNIKKGDRVGYGCTFTAKEDMTIATIPLGYYEGVDIRLSNKGFVKIGSHFAPIIGRVSMNITTIDISKISNVKSRVKMGDKVVVISNKKEDRNSIENIAKNCNTIPYEILVHIPAHLKRVLGVPSKVLNADSPARRQGWEGIRAGFGFFVLAGFGL